MSISISTVETRADLKRFVKFPWTLFQGNPCWIPPLISDEIGTLSPGKNPAFENAEARLFTAHREGRMVGRIAAILSHAANKKYGIKNLRFGWFDTVDDFDVARSLLDAACAWGRERGMETLTGPQGFTDLDYEGLLVEGFNELATINVIYNHPYYPVLLERYGLAKDVDFVEYQGTVSDGTVIPEKMAKMADWAAKRNGIRLLKFKSARKLSKERGQEVFDLLDEVYEDLYGTVPLTQRQKEYYIGKYVPFVNPDFIEAAVNKEGVLVGFILSIPSLSRALQKANGRLLPFGLIYILRALRRCEKLDFLLAGVKKEYQGKGVDLIMTIDVMRTGLAKGVRVTESNPELELNAKIQNEWKIIDTRQHKRRRIYKMRIV